jgi:hypothetical protein
LNVTVLVRFLVVQAAWFRWDKDHAEWIKDVIMPALPAPGMTVGFTIREIGDEGDWFDAVVDMVYWDEDRPDYFLATVRVADTAWQDNEMQAVRDGLLATGWKRGDSRNTPFALTRMRVAPCGSNASPASTSAPLTPSTTS